MFEESDGESNLQQQQNPTCSKRFWSFIKHAHTDKTGIVSLKSGGLVLTDPSAKADLLNKQSKSVFSQTGPMKLTHISEAALNQQMSGRLWPKLTSQWRGSGNYCPV